MDIFLYLNRINYTNNLAVTFNALHDLQRGHLLNIPFENLDIYHAQNISLDKESLYNKIVLNKRGGFCYELNGLFYKLLISLGFNAKMISARVYNEEKGYGQEFDHLAILVKIGEDQYLTDVGFGEFSLSPLKFELGTKQKDRRGVFLFDKYDEKYFRINKIEDSEMIPQYIFTTEERKLQDFEEMCNYHQTSSDSHFTHKKAISIPTENGRITLTNDKLKITENEKLKEIVISSEDEFDKLLLDYFKIEL